MKQAFKWYTPSEALPACPPGQMIPVILQRRGKVFGGWYCNEYEMGDPAESLDVDDNGNVTGFCEKQPHGEYDYFEFAGMHDVECWAYMPPPREALLP